MGSGIRTQVPRLVRQALYPLSRLPCLLVLLFLFGYPYPPYQGKTDQFFLLCQVHVVILGCGGVQALSLPFPRKIFCGSLTHGHILSKGKHLLTLALWDDVTSPLPILAPDVPGAQAFVL